MLGAFDSFSSFNLFAYCRNNPAVFCDSNGFLPICFENPEYERAWEFGCWIKEKHYGRNKYNPIFPKMFDAVYFAEWDDSVAANCHQFTAPNRDNKKYVSPDGKYEAIYSSDGKLVDDPRDVGTYNYASPNDHPIKHFVVDVLPWILIGNSPEDTTWPHDRLLAFVGVYLN